MATAPRTVRLTHINGANVSVTEDKVERLLAGGLFSKSASRSTRKADDAG